MEVFDHPDLISLVMAGAGESETEPLAMAYCGHVPTVASLAAATTLLCQQLPDMKIRFVNVVDLLKRVAHTEYPHGMKGDNHACCNFR